MKYSGAEGDTSIIFAAVGPFNLQGEYDFSDEKMIDSIGL
jgi:hypothetical protein